MSKLYTLGFFLIAGGAFGVIDYNQQATNAGKTLQTYDIVSYADTRLGSVGGVFTGALEAKRLKRRQQKPASTHLPEPPEGWTRRPWADSDKAVFLPYVDFSMGDAEKQQAEEGVIHMDYAALYESYTPLQLIDVARDEDPNANFLEKSMRMPQDKMLHRDVFIYRKGDEFVALRATYDPRYDKPKSAMELAMLAIGAQIGGTIQVPGYAYYDGVPFQKDKTILDSEFVPRGIRLVSAEVSPSIRVQAWFMASATSVRELLSKVDYPALNAMLNDPVEGVIEMPDMELEDQLAEATAILTKKKKDELEKANVFLAKLQKKAQGSNGLMGLNADGMDQLAALAAMEQRGIKIDPGQAAALGLPAQGASQPPADDRSLATRPSSGQNTQAAGDPAGAIGAVLNQMTFELGNLSGPSGGDKMDAATVGGGAAEMPAPVTFTPPAAMGKRDQMQLMFKLMGAGIKPENAKMRFDGIVPDAAQEWAQMQAGTLTKDHPAYAVRAREVAENLAPGSCLELVDRKVHCGSTANMIRTALSVRESNFAAKAERKTAASDGVKVNQLSSGSAARTTTAGGFGKNCIADGAFKRCSVSE